MDAYFDTNVYDIFRRDAGVTDALVAKLDEAVRGGALRVFTSFPVIEETNAARLKKLDETNGRFELIRTLTVVKDLIIKRQPEIIDGDMRAYANGQPSPSKFQTPYPGLKDIFWDHTARHYKELDSYARDTLEEVSAFTKDLDDSFNRLIRPLVKDAKKNTQQQPFNEYWDEMAEPWVEQLATKYGLIDECKRKGLKGLLDVHSIRITTMAQVSLTYANIYERGKFDRGNSRDMHHVACASAVPTFVTHDRPLTRVLTRVPCGGLEVMNLQALLDRL